MVKMLLALIISIVSTILVFLTALFFGETDGGSPLTFDGLKYIGYFFLQSLSYCGLAMLFSMLFKRSGITIGVFFLYSLILERMIAGILNKYVGNVGYFFPLRAGDSLIPFPFFKTISRRLFTLPDLTYLLIAVFIYFILYFFLIKRKFETSDL